MMSNETEEERQFLDEHKRKFRNFLNPPDDDGEYVDRIHELRNAGQNRLIVNLDELRAYDNDLANGVLNDPLRYMRPLEGAVTEVADALNTADDDGSMQLDEEDDTLGKRRKKDNNKYFVGVEGSFGANHTTPRGLTSKLLSKMVCVEGIVTKVSVVRPKVKKSVHYCPKTKKHVLRNYRDATSLDGPATSSVYPTKDEEGNPLETEFGLCEYKDFQTVVIQEMPESAPLGQLPRSIEAMVEGDLVDKVKPGDRIHMTGIFRALAPMSAANTSGNFRTVLLANHVRGIGKEVNGLVMRPTDIKYIKSVAKRNDVFTLLSRSLAPSIYGHSYIKKALLLMLLGGCEKNLDNGTHLRGDINILLVGDPSTAKSQLLRFVLGIAPLAVNTTGRGSSGVGLTAAVTSDPDTGERRLEAGAMVLADRGVVCIDEFDKMSDGDRVAIHEVMEQQTVTIAKAGIHTSLNARCSVLAAANPIYGGYDRTMSAQRNVGLPDSLLSRFDLLFIVLDTLDAGMDRAISDHVLRMHRYQEPGYEGVPVPLDGSNRHRNNDEDNDDDDDTGANSNPFQKINPLLHGGIMEELRLERVARLSGKKRKQRQQSRENSTGNGDDENGDDDEEDGDDEDDNQGEQLFTMPFVKKFIHYAKNRFKPKLTDEASSFISAAYAEMRQSAAGSKTLPVTPRALETIIRLSSAHAKSRLSRVVEEIDCRVALGKFGGVGLLVVLVGWLCALVLWVLLLWFVFFFFFFENCCA